MVSDPRHAYSHRQGESVTRSDRRRRELKLENSSPSLACLCESHGVVSRWGLAGQDGRSRSARPLLKLGTANSMLQFELSCFANYRICPALLAPRHTSSTLQLPSPPPHSGKAQSQETFQNLRTSALFKIKDSPFCTNSRNVRMMVMEAIAEWAVKFLFMPEVAGSKRQPNTFSSTLGGWF